MNESSDSEIDKSYRVLSINECLSQGEAVSKKKLSDEFQVSEKTIQRDIEELKTFHYEKDRSIVRFDVGRHGYVLEKQSESHLTNKEIVLLNKILIDSRALNKEEFSQLFEKLVYQASPEDRKLIRELLLNECFHYVPMRHGKPLLDRIWETSNYIRQQRVLKISYQRQDKVLKKYEVKPVGLVFSEFYFYLIAYIKDMDKPFPAIFRLDRISELIQTKETFTFPYVDRFEEGLLENRIQFMYSGELMKITFRFWGASLDAVLDRLPTARIKGKSDKGTIIEAEVFGTGIKMWLLSQMEFLEVLGPKSFREDMIRTIKKMYSVYLPDENG